MKYTILPYDDTQAHGLNRYIVDEASDIETLPAYIQPGSKAIVANSGDVYLLNNEHKWIKQRTASGSGGMSAEEIEEILIEKGYATEAFVTNAIAGVEESDPNIAAWAKAAEKPTYTAAEVGALPDTTVIPDVSGFYTKPTNGIPASDLASGVVPDLSNYVLKSNPTFTAALSLGRRAYTGKGDKSVALGTNVEASGTNSFATGYFAAATGSAAHAEGNTTHADGDASHAEGHNTYAMAQQAHAEGWASNASGRMSHAEGYITKAVGRTAHSEGEDTRAIGYYSHSEGLGTRAVGDSSHVFGQFNIPDEYNTELYPAWVSGTEYELGDIVSYEHIIDTVTYIRLYQCINATSSDQFLDTDWQEVYDQRLKYVEIVGNGVLYTPSNARTLDWDGNEVLAGTLTVARDPVANMEVATKAYVDANAGGGLSPLIITATDNAGNLTLNKTYNEIKEAFFVGCPCIIIINTDYCVSVSAIYTANNYYYVEGRAGNQGLSFSTNTTDGYPYINFG